MITKHNVGLRRYLYEYAFFNMIKRNNAILTASTPPSGISNEVVNVSQARQLRSKLNVELAKTGQDLDSSDLKPVSFLNAATRVLKHELGDSYKLSKISDNWSRDYKTFSGRISGKDNVLPISPIDPRWSIRQTVIDNGLHPLYLDGKSVDAAVGNEVKNIHAKTGLDLFKYVKTDEESEYEIVGPALQLEDACGLSALRPYISSDDYTKCADWLKAGGSVGRSETGRPKYKINKYMDYQTINKSRDLLEHLANEGVDYEVKPDLNPGQLNLHLQSSDISVRLTDTNENQQWVGRVYNDGVSIYYSTTKRNPTSHKYESYNPSAEEIVDLIKFAKGEPVTRPDGKGIVGHIGTESTGRPSSYKTSAGYTAVYKNFPGDDKNYITMRKSTIGRKTPQRYFAPTEDGKLSAQEFLVNALNSSKERIKDEIDVPGLIAAYNENPEGATSGDWFPPDLDRGDTDIAGLRRLYWDKLRGESIELIHPNMDRSEYDEAVKILKNQDAYDIEEIDDAKSKVYLGEVEQQIKDHFEDVLDSDFGVILPNKTIKLDPVRVARYMESPYGQFRNNDDLAMAMRRLDFSTDNILGDSFYTDTFKDRLIKIDTAHLTSIENQDNDVAKHFMTVVKESLEVNAIEPTTIVIDDNGVIGWKGVRAHNAKGDKEALAGTIGQVLIPDDRGAMITKRLSGNNHMIVPGYDAHVMAQKAGEQKSLEERTRLVGYQQVMSEAIRNQINIDVSTSRSIVGEGASLNSVYRKLTDTRHPADYDTYSLENGMDAGLRDAILRTESKRVRYSNDLGSGSGIVASELAKLQLDHNLERFENGSQVDPFVLTGGRNINILDKNGDGYYDPVMTSDKKPGLVRFLTENAVVNADGSITPSENPADRAPLAIYNQRLYNGKPYSENDSFDRSTMTTTNLINASSVSKPSGAAMMTLGGWTMEDAVVVSDKFTKENKVRNENGELRNLRVGDKISDLHGNKGVISLVVDTNMDRDEFAETIYDAENLDKGHQIYDLFAQNPDLNVVMSPFSCISRYNAGTTLELHDNARELNINGEALPGGMGDLRFIITQMTVDKKTRVYDRAALRAGKGRKSSLQLVSALSALKCDKILDEMYQSNDAALADLREFSLLMGVDIASDGTLKLGYDDMAVGGERQLFELGDLPLSDDGKRLNIRKVRDSFAKTISRDGGDMELPFELTLGDGLVTAKATDNTWRLPVLSSHLRSGQSLEDGSQTTHDYTGRYLAIHESAMRYQFAKYMLANGGDKQKYDAVLKDEQIKAQASLDTMLHRIAEREFSGKHNRFKDSIASVRLPRSATSVITPDPTLDLNQIGVNPEIAKSLGVKEGDILMAWRDPILRGASVMAYPVHISERIDCVAINPVDSKAPEGDFDGDQYGLYKLRSPEAIAQAKENLTLEARLLDTGRARDPESLMLPLRFHTEIDVAVGMDKMGQDQKDRLEDLIAEANDTYRDYQNNEITKTEYLESNRDTLSELSRVMRETLSENICYKPVVFDNMTHHLDSVKSVCLDTGAKGSEAKLHDYMRYLGVTGELGEDGKMQNVEVFPSTLVTREEVEGVQFASGTKSAATGLAGKFQQRGLTISFNDDPESALETTMPNTQLILGAKKDPVDAKRRLALLLGPMRNLCRGERIELMADPSTGEKYWGKSANQRPMSTKEWADTFEAVHISPYGMNVNLNRELIDRWANEISSGGIVLGVEDENLIAQKADPLPLLAYRGDVETLRKLAKEGANLYDGVNTQHMAGKTTRLARELKSRELENELDAVQSKNVPEVMAAKDTLPKDATPRLPRRERTKFTSAVRGAVSQGVELNDIVVKDTQSDLDFEM